MIDFSLYLITDRHQVAPDQTLSVVIEAALRNGVKAVQLREKDLSASQLLPVAKELRQLTSSYGAKLFINHHVEIVNAVAADGVHLGGESIATAEARRLLGPDKLIGVSTHALDDVFAAEQEGADFVTFGPVYATPSKVIYGPPLGLAALADVCQKSSLPVFALGGIKAEDITAVREAGASGIALISAIIASSNPGEATKAFTA